MKAVGLDFEGGAVGCASGERAVEKRSHEADMAKKTEGVVSCGTTREQKLEGAFG